MSQSKLTRITFAERHIAVIRWQIVVDGDAPRTSVVGLQFQIATIVSYRLNIVRYVSRKVRQIIVDVIVWFERAPLLTLQSVNRRVHSAVVVGSVDCLQAFDAEILRSGQFCPQCRRVKAILSACMCTLAS